MKKLVVLAVLILALSATMASANHGAFANWTLTLTMDGGGSTTQAAYSTALDTGSQKLYSVYMKADAKILTAGAATLTGNFAGSKIWNYQYSNDGSSWTDMAFIVSGFSSPADTYDEVTLTSVVSAQYFRLGYDVTLTAPTYAQAQGAGQLTVKAVPEASTMVGFGSALVMAGPGMFAWIRRKRS